MKKHLKKEKKKNKTENETVANWKLGKVGNLGNLGKIIRSFLFSEFSILPYSQNPKHGFKNLGKKFPKFSRFLRFPSFRPGHQTASKFKVDWKQIRIWSKSEEKKQTQKRKWRSKQYGRVKFHNIKKRKCTNKFVDMRKERKTHDEMVV